MRYNEGSSDVLGIVKVGDNVYVHEEISGEKILPVEGIVLELTISHVTVSVAERCYFATGASLYLMPNPNFVSSYIRFDPMLPNSA